MSTSWIFIFEEVEPVAHPAPASGAAAAVGEDA